MEITHGCRTLRELNAWILMKMCSCSSNVAFVGCSNCVQGLQTSPQLSRADLCEKGAVPLALMRGWLIRHAMGSPKAYFVMKTGGLT